MRSRGTIEVLLNVCCVELRLTSGLQIRQVELIDIRGFLTYNQQTLAQIYQHDWVAIFSKNKLYSIIWLQANTNHKKR